MGWYGDSGETSFDLLRCRSCPGAVCDSKVGFAPSKACLDLNGRLCRFHSRERRRKETNKGSTLGSRDSQENKDQCDAL